MKKINLIAVVLLFLSSSMFAQKIVIDIQKSTIEWVGKKISGQHNGNIQLKSGNFVLKGKNVVSGSFVVDMKSITVTDIKKEEMNKKLVDHLKNEDFFGVEKFPTASFVVTKVSKLKNGNALIAGKITIKGKTEPISFETTIQDKTYSAKLEIDRTKFDIKYGSNSFFDNLGDRAIDNIFTLDIKLVVK